MGMNTFVYLKAIVLIVTQLLIGDFRRPWEYLRILESHCPLCNTDFDWLFQEAMKLMGMNTLVYWGAIVLKAFIFNFITVLFFTILLKVNTGENGRVLSESNAGVILIFLLIYSMSLVAFCIMISAFFSKGKKNDNTVLDMPQYMYAKI